MNYHPVSSAWNWQPNLRVNMQYGQYRTHYPAGNVNVGAVIHNAGNVNVRAVISFQSVWH